ncbi:malate dehydrogenase (quinone) [Pontiella sulfatireligans]|uniref:Probable malate:quinone oxidoreductase n=1 Tax=Pontiella sulfatireligans TaxID=2750658 RepID=A0A6C2UPM1_9BACT|nr:malate dehydrogenase (quinone) [Pontiella sulfatireligans]VGO22225.1 putative malate:quinone oxidoreductase 1 [Pontiella sulfatireligans]
MKNDHDSDPILEAPDVVLIGAGIMSATLGMMLKQLNPALTIQIIEGLPQVAQESSNAWNNAGTGHAALCELNYTPEGADGEIDISKAARINEQFETSKHFWGYLVEQGIITEPSAFVRPCPHMSFVWGAANQDFLRKRHAAMTKSHLFETMKFTTDAAIIEQWAPLLTQGRPSGEALAGTRVEAGTDVNYGALTRHLIDHLVSLDGVQLALDTQVTNIVREKGGRWKIVFGGHEAVSAGFVFIGGGGGALPLLQKSGIPEGKGFGGFPVSGQFLVCKNPEIVGKHGVKVYGKAAVGAPPMSVPHLDTRIINGNKSLLFGPYAGFSPKYLKTGSNLDLFKSVKPDNLLPMLAAGRDNMPLTQYLINECRKSHEGRCNMLREFFPDAKDEDWKLITAGQRVQIIKKDPRRTGVLQFGTEVVASGDGSLATVLGASPGASTATSIILQVLEQCFPAEMASEDWKKQLAEMVPAFGINLAEDPAAYTALGAKAQTHLKLG